VFPSLLGWNENVISHFRKNTKFRLFWQHVTKIGFLRKFNFSRISFKHFCESFRHFRIFFASNCSEIKKYFCETTKTILFSPVSNIFRLSKYAYQDCKNRIKKMLYSTFKNCTQPAFAYFCLPSPAPINVRGKQSSIDNEVKDIMWVVTVSYLLIALWWASSCLLTLSPYFFFFPLPGQQASFLMKFICSLQALTCTAFVLEAVTELPTRLWIEKTNVLVDNGTDISGFRESLGATEIANAVRKKSLAGIGTAIRFFETQPRRERDPDR